MRGLSLENVKANQDYKEVVKRKIKLFVIIFILGLIMTLIAIGNAIFNVIPVQERITILYSGIGAGLIGASVVILFRYKKLLKNESALKEERLKTLDERNILISQMAAKSAAMFLILVSYIAMLIGGLFSEVIFYCFWFVVMIFLLAYLFFSLYYRNKKI